MFLFPFFILLVAFLLFRIKRSTTQEKQASESYRSYVHNADFVRKKDISQLDYIKIPLKELPFQAQGDPELLKLQDKVASLADTDILNLTGINNTELKYKYGAANLDKLAVCDNNFIKLSRALFNWGMWLYEHEKIDDAQKVLEYAVSCKVDISSIYTTLAAIYAQKGELDKITQLKEQASTLQTLMKTSILKSLSSYEEL